MEEKDYKALLDDAEEHVWKVHSFLDDAKDTVDYYSQEYDHVEELLDKLDELIALFNEGEDEDEIPF